MGEYFLFDFQLRRNIMSGSAPSQPKNAAAAAGPEAPVVSVDLSAARDLLKVFARMARAMRIYARNNDVWIRFWGELTRGMTGYLDAHGLLSLSIGTGEVKVQGEVIFQPKGQDDNFAFRMYKDGLRQIDFLKGIPEAELLRFLEIITADFDRGEMQDKDVVSLLWECEFKHIFTLSVDSFVQEAQTDPEEEEEGPPQDPIALADEEADQLLEMLQQSQEINLLKLDFEEKREYRQVAMGSTSFEMRAGGEKVQLLPIDPLLEQELRAEVEELATVETPIEPMAEVFFELFRQETPEDYAELLDIIMKVVNNLLIDAELETLNALLFPVRLLSQPDYARAFYHHGMVLELFRRLGDPVLLEPLLGAIQEGRLKGGVPAFFGFFALMVPERIPGLLEWLERIEDELMRRAGVDALLLVAGDSFDAFHHAVRVARPLLVADILLAMGRLASIHSLDVIVGAVAHPDAHVREEALVALRGFESPRAREITFQAIQDEVEAVRLAALRSLTVLRDRQTSRYLNEQLAARTLKNRSFHELRAMCMALAHILGSDALPTLKGVIEARRMPDWQRASVHGLAVLGSEGKRVLEQAQRDSSGPVLEEIRSVLARLK